MKKISMYVMGLILSGASLISCDDESSDHKLIFDTNGAEAFVGAETLVKVSGGVAPYQATPTDTTIAEVEVDGSEITIKGLKVGSTTVKVTDKSGENAMLSVVVKVDPYESDKDDASVRIQWDTYDKEEGDDDGVYKLTKAADKTVTFSWVDEEDDNSLVLTFKDSNDKIGGTSQSASLRESPVVAGTLKVTVNGVTTNRDVVSWRLVQAAPADDEVGTPNTYWIAFTAHGKSGLCVAPLTIAAQ